MSTSIEGVCDPRFAAVREAFAGNFEKHGEIGAAVALYVGGRKVVDLWGGWADRARTRPWAEDTLVNFYSIGKAMAATVVLWCVQRGLLDLDSPVARWWPEFAAAGKEAITLRQLMSHSGGLPAVTECGPLPADAMLDWGRMVRALEMQPPWWTPGEAHGYHVNTFGYLLGEPVRRAAGMTLGTLLRQEVAGPLGADIWIGLPESEHGRVADFLHPLPREPVPQPKPLKAWPPIPPMQLMRACAYSNPPGISGGPRFVNTAAWRLAEIPSTNGHGTARGVARVYQGLLEGLIDADLLAEATREHSAGMDLILERPSRFGLGYQLTQKERPLGPNPRAFGHFGAGGSLGFCDPDAGVAFAYVMNDMGARWQNPRNGALIESIYRSL